MPKKEIMRLSDKSVLLISNAQSTTEEDNTLTNFSGSIPSNFLNQHKSWKVAVHSCGIHMMLKQPLTPKYENLPSIIQITYENLDILAKTHRLAGLGQFKLDMFKNSLQFYVDREKSYTSKTLADDFQKQATSNLLHKQRPFEGIPVKHDETTERIYFGQFENDGKDSDARISKLPRKKKGVLNIRIYK